ncbi:MAG TPA: HlyD family efflux transporter periplasmic adaptor subunit [Kiritimatiellia bacterium]|nr:HlyD family efflux transporter periplasmic adaptor subunit [Kiritimatiellia bacterium]HSA19744.1 HlyD family efflux transporter periplasmic adaptor subunit [Kiritimatiellia bacterium]
MRLKIAAGLAAGLAMAAIALRWRNAEAAPACAEVVRGPLEIWSVYDGTLESRRVQDIMFLSGGPATIAELVPEGTRVQQGDLLVRFDTTQLESDMLKLDRDAALARADLASLENAKIPLEIRELEVNLAKATSDHEAERQYLEDSRQLLQDGLISDQEVAQQEVKVAAAKAQAERLSLQLDLTKKFLHPSALDRARATLASSEQELRLARERLSNGVVRAPVSGMVVYRPIHVGAEYRTVRVGDTIYRNQAFLALPDMSEPVVQCDVPEAELSRLRAGAPVVIVPAAYPQLRLSGAVESVGSMAQSRVGLPGWQKYFHVVIGVADTDERLRAGMTVRASVLSYSNPGALQLPRRAVQWDGEEAWCEVIRGKTRERRALRLGQAGEEFIEVLEGLAAGERVALP